MAGIQGNSRVSSIRHCETICTEVPILHPVAYSLGISSRNSNILGPFQVMNHGHPYSIAMHFIPCSVIYIPACLFAAAILFMDVIV